MTDTAIARTELGFRAATFGDVLRSEWVKLRSVRATFWALAVTVVLGIALGAVISGAARQDSARLPTAAKRSGDPTGGSQSGMVFAQRAIVVLGVLFISSEYS